MLLRSLRLGTLNFVLIVVLTAPAVASARSVSYTGEATKLRAGQTRGLPVYVGFVLLGKGCPAKPACLEHAKVRAINAVDWAYPGCYSGLHDHTVARRTHRPWLKLTAMHNPDPPEGT